MAKILVTGGAGFIGSHVVDHLLRDGHHVEVMDDLSSGKRSNLPAGVTLHHLDIRSVEARALVERMSPEIIVHLAAQISVRISMDDPHFDSTVNVAGLVNLLQGTRSFAKPPHVVFISTGGAIYGEQEMFPASEDHPTRPASFYGLAKRVGELYLDLWSKTWNLPFTVLRLANVYGPRQNPHGEAGVVAIFCQRLLEDKAPVINGSGTQTRDFVFVEDVARAVTQACARRVTGIFNVGTARETSVNELYDLVRGALGSDLAAIRGEAKQGEQMRSCVSPERARALLDWTPKVSVAEGVARTAEWFRAAAPRAESVR